MFVIRVVSGGELICTNIYIRLKALFCLQMKINIFCPRDDGVLGKMTKETTCYILGSANLTTCTHHDSLSYEGKKQE